MYKAAITLSDSKGDCNSDGNGDCNLQQRLQLQRQWQWQQ